MKLFWLAVAVLPLTRVLLHLGKALHRLGESHRIVEQSQIDDPAKKIPVNHVVMPAANYRQEFAVGCVLLADLAFDAGSAAMSQNDELSLIGADSPLSA